MTTTQETLAKVPAVTLVFWVIKILATTLGETAGDALSMSLDLGYLVSTVIFFVLFLVAVLVQTAAKRFHTGIYWTTIVATTTVGTTLADFADRSLNIGYAGGSSLILLLLIGTLLLWYSSLGTIAVGSVSSRKSEIFYWITILFSQTLGTALGDWVADSLGLGYLGAALVFGSFLALIGLGYSLTTLSRTWLFWGAFILTRPLGAVIGDFLDKPLEDSGLALSRYSASGVLLTCIVICILIFPQKPASQKH
jgi:uncharacterized membrane-anchored protein